MSRPASNPSARTGRGRHHWWSAAAGVVGDGVRRLPRQSPGAGTAPGGPAVLGPAASAGVSRGAAPREAVQARWVPGAPRRVLIPRLDVDAAVRPVKAPGGTLVPPSDPQQLAVVGRRRASGRPDRQRLVTGHTVHAGGGALDNLETLRRGDRVTVVTDRGRIRYAVRSVAVYAKGALARQAQRLFQPGGPRPAGADHLRGLGRLALPQQRGRHGPPAP